MQSITLPVTDEGIVIPRAAARLLGFRSGDWAEVQVRPLPSSEELKDKALYYAMHHLGDAVFVGEPEWADDGWRLPLRVRNREGIFGVLFLSPEGGDVVEARSTSLMELLEALRAAGADDPSAG